MFNLMLIYTLLFHPVLPQDLVLSGYISSIPIHGVHSNRFEFTTVAGKKYLLSSFNVTDAFHGGEHWQFTVRVKPPHGHNNPGGFDYEQYLLSHHIVAGGYIKSAKKLADQWWQYPILKARAHLVERTRESQYQDIVLALTLGMSTMITTEHKQVFQNTGTSHLMAISGLHIGMIAGFFYFLAQYSTRLFPSMLLRLPKQRFAAIIALLFALLYSALTGFSFSTQRALIMVSLFMLRYFICSQITLMTSLVVALVVILLIDPLAIFSAGLWLSFWAVFVLIYGLSGRLASTHAWIKAQLVCFIGLMPLSIWYFYNISLVSVLANIIAISYVGFVVVPLSLLGIVVGHIGFASVAFDYVYRYLNYLSALNLSHLSFVMQTKWQLFAAIIAVLLMLTPRSLKLRLVGLLWLLPVVFVHKDLPALGKFYYTVLDVGQGLATVVRTKNHTMVYDTGPKFDEFDSGERIVIPYLQYIGVNRLDRLVVSHGDNDHAGGAAAIIKKFHPEVFTSEPARVDRQATVCDRKIHWQWDGVNFQFLNIANFHDRKDNNNSCVLKITSNDNSVLLTGDIEARTEKFLALQYGKQLASDILVVPHHGSKTSSTEEFVRAVNPKTAVFSYGFLNRFHHPSDKVVQRYRNLHIKTRNTVDEGAIRG